MKNYGLSKPLKFLTYLDMNNLHGWGMSLCLPYDRFRKLKNADNFDNNIISENIMEVDLNVPINYMYSTRIIY